MTAKKKKQHYVPLSYLRKFSVNQNNKQIGIFNTNRDLYIEKGELKNQAKKNYYYDNDGKIEEGLGIIEDLSIKIIDNIIKTETLPLFNTQDHISLLTFVIILAFRTKFYGNQTNETIDQFYKKVYKHDKAFEDIKIGLNFPSSFSLSVIPNLIPVVIDLRCKILKNKTNIPFITSDNPVIRYNQFLEKRKHKASIVGLDSKGFQMILPITPQLALLYYDSWVYKVGYKKQTVIEIKRADEINQINILQILNCEENLYFNKLKVEYLSNLKLRSNNFDKAGKISVEEFRKMNQDGEENEESLLITKTSESKIDLFIDQIKETSKAKAFKLDNRLFYSRQDKV